MTKVTITIDDKNLSTEHNSTLLSIFKEYDIPVKQICGGQGMCASCHLFVVCGGDALSPPTHQELMTLQFTKIERSGARLACQTRVIDDGVIIDLPQGTVIESEQELELAIGKRAPQTLIHPLTGEILVEKGKLVLRSALEKMQQASSSFKHNLSQNK